MKPGILKPKLTLNADFEPSETALASLRLDIKSQQNFDIEPTPRALSSRLPSYNTRRQPSRELESYASIDIGVVSPYNQNFPVSTGSMNKIPVISPASSQSKIFPTGFSKAPSLAINHIRNPEKMLIGIPEEPQLPAVERPVTGLRIATERLERSNEYFGNALGMPQIQTSRSGETNRPFNFKTLSNMGLERFHTEGFEESVFEKNSQITERGSKTFKKKVSALNFAEMRKTFFGTRNLSHDFRNTNSFIPQASQSRSRQYSRANSGKIEDDNIFFLTEKGAFKESVEESDIADNVNTTESETVDICENQSNNITLQKSVVTYCKISTMDKYSPLSISIMGAKNIKRIRTFVSATNQRPSKGTCDDKYEARNFKLYEKNRASPRFLNPYFYLAILPNESGIISLKIEFAQKKPAAFHDSKKSPGKLMMKKGYFPNLPINLERKDLYIEIGKIKRERKEKMLLLSQGIDKIEFNKNTEQYIPSRACERREMLKQKSEDHFRMAQSRKTILDHEKKGMRKANMMRHDLQKIIKEIAYAETKKALTLKFLLEKWFINIFFCKLGGSIKQILEKQKIVKAKRERIAFALAAFSAKMQTALKKKGDSASNRLHFDIRMALQFHAKAIKHYSRPEVERIVISFLQDNMVIHYLKNKFMNTLRSLKKVQVTFRQYQKRKDGFKTCLLMLWDKNYMKIYHECMHIGSVSINTSQTGVVAKPVLRKLQTLDLSVIDTARKKFVKTWFRRCIANYKKNYHIHHLEIAGLSYQAKQQWHLQHMFMKVEQKQKEEPLIEKLRKASRQGLMEEFRKNRIAAIDYSGPEVTQKQKLVPPRLFILPTQEELETVIREVIMIQRETVKL